MTKQNEYTYIIIGAGMSASFAGKELRKLDEDSSILILGQEGYGPYKRPPLTKDLWSDDADINSVFYKINEDDSVDIQTETHVSSINKENKTVTTEAGNTYSYDKLLLATGGRPNQIDGPESERVLTYRTLDDYKHVQELLKDTKDAIVVGGGFIGAEISASMSEEGANVTMIYPDDLLGEKMFPQEIAETYTQTFKDNKVKLVNNSRAKSYDVDGDKVSLTTEDGQIIEADILVFGLGITPNIELAEAAGLDVDGGVIVDEYFKTSDANIYAAGDIAKYPDIVQGNVRVEHEDHARVSGKKAARNMVGEIEAYDYIPLFYSDLFDIEYEAYGKIDASLDTIIEPLNDGKLVYYLDGDKPQGFLNWNIYPDRSKIRDFLKEDSVDVENIKGTVTK